MMQINFSMSPSNLFIVVVTGLSKQMCYAVKVALPCCFCCFWCKLSPFCSHNFHISSGTNLSFPIVTFESKAGGWKVNSSAEVSFWGNRGAADIRKISPTKFQATEFGDTWYVEYWIQRYCFRSTFWHNQKWQIWNIFCLKYEYFVEIFAAFASNHLYLLRKFG